MDAPEPPAFVDTVRYSYSCLSGAILGPNSNVTISFDELGDEERMRGWKRLPETGAWVTVVAGRAYVEASLPRVLHGHNICPVTPEQAVPVLAGVHDEAVRFVHPVPGGEDVPTGSLHRVDPVLDFEQVECIPSILRSLAV